MTEIDRKELEDEFMKVWKDLAKILWVAALNSKKNFPYWEGYFQSYAFRIIEFLGAGKKGIGSITGDQETALYYYLQPLTGKVEGNVDLGEALIQDKVDVNKFKKLAEEVEKRLHSIRRAMDLGIQTQEEQERD